MADQETVAKLEHVWQSIDELCAGLSDTEWDLASDCPGWSVKDNLSHVIGTESMLLGRPAPDHVPPEAEYVKNPVGQANEVWVDSRRGLPGPEVLEEFREVTRARREQLRAMSEDDWARETPGPMGVTPYRDFMQIRIFDCWVHEQDIRRAVGRPGHLSGAVAEHSLGRVLSAMPFVVGKKAGTPDGASVVFEISDTGQRLPVVVTDGRAGAADDVPESPTVVIRTDLETLSYLGCGRRPPGAAMEEGRIQIEGDQELGRRVVENLNFMI